VEYEECILGDEETNMRALWSIRETSAIGCEKEGYNLPYDVSL